MGHDEVIALRLSQHDEQLKEIRASQLTMQAILTRLETKVCENPGACVGLSQRLETLFALHKEHEARISGLDKLLGIVVETTKQNADHIKTLITNDNNSQLKFARAEGRAGMIGVVTSAVVTLAIASVGWIAHFLTAWAFHPAVSVAGK